MVEHSTDSLNMVVEPNLAGRRLDLVLSEAVRAQTASRSMLARWIQQGRATVNGETVKPSYRVKPGDRVHLRLPPPPQSEVLPEPIPLDVLYEDDQLLVVNKPQGMVVHPAAGVTRGTLVNGLLGRGIQLSTAGGSDRPGIVHRLDKDTSGLLMVANTDLAHRHLSGQLGRRIVLREYRTLAFGIPSTPEGFVDQPVGRHVKDRKRMSTVTARGREAYTAYRLLETLPGPISHLALKLRTGRTHQIRVHLSSIGHPVVGDRTYGGRVLRTVQDKELAARIRRLPGQLLHARVLGFQHPSSGEDFRFEAEPPDTFQELLHWLRRCASRDSRPN